MMELGCRIFGAIRNIFDPEPLPVARHAEQLSSDVCDRAGEYVREHNALAAAIRESRVERYHPRLARARATR